MDVVNTSAADSKAARGVGMLSCGRGATLAGDLSVPFLDSSSLAPDSDEPVLELSPDGVDLGLIRWMLSLTPTQRLEVLQDFVDGALALRDGREAED